MARNRVIYQSEAVFVSKNITSSGAFAHSQLRRIQSANYNYSVQRTDVNQYANLARIDAIVIEQPVVNLELTYLIGDGFNEKALGFTLEKDYEAQFGKEMFGSTFSGQNFYITTVEEGLDANLLSQSAVTSALANNNTSVIGIGNGYITNYSADFTVGALAIASVSIEASNIMSTGNLPRKSLYEEAYTGIPIASINPADGVKRTEQISLDFANAGLTDGISALRPGDVTVTIANSGIASNTFAVQSAKIAFPMSRESISKVGSRFAVAKVATFPIVSTITISATLGDLEARNLADQIDSVNTTDITLTVTGGSDNQEKISYRLKKCKLDSESFSASIGSNKTVELTFSTQIGGSNDSTNGIFVNGGSQESPFEFYLDAYNNLPAAYRESAHYIQIYNETSISESITANVEPGGKFKVYRSDGSQIGSDINDDGTLSMAAFKGLRTFAVVAVQSNGTTVSANDFLVNVSSINTNIVNVYQRSKALGIIVPNNKIKNLELLTGSETKVMTFLDELDCSNNQLTNLNLSGFTGGIVTLNCSYNQLTNLNLVTAGGMSYLNCSNNKLTSLNLNTIGSTYYSGLVLLNCSNNQLTSLDFSNFQNLSLIDLSNNKLNTLTIPATLVSIESVNIENCNLPATQLNALLTLLATSAYGGPNLVMSGNQTNTSTQGLINILTSAGWTVAN